jgi:ankyrin repeat protein
MKIYKFRHLLITVSFALAVFFLLPIILNAQQLPDYLFLEVLDSKGETVSAAEVQTVKSDFTRSDRKRFTDEKGKIQFFLPWTSQYENLDSYFTVIKEGFFTYHDFGGSGGRGDSKAQIELLTIPQTEAEKRFLGNEQLKREFMWAAKTGDAETVKKLLKKGISPNLTTSDLRGVSGRKDVPAIVFAALSADSETIAILIKAGVRIKNKDEPFRSILSKYLRSDPFFLKKPKDENEQKIILQKYQNGVDILLKAGADYTSVTESDLKPPIMIAAEKGYVQAVKLLLDKGVSVNSKDANGRSLFYYAAEGDWEGKISKIEMIEFLLARGADTQNECSPALFTASSRGDLPVIKTLLKRGAEINPKCGSSLWNAVSRRKTEAARFLIESGADLDFKDYSGAHLLMIAAKNQDAETVQLLIDKGFPVNKKSIFGATALTEAINWVSRPNLDTIKILLKSGANPDTVINYENSTGCFSPLIQAVQNQYSELINLLIEYKADINLPCGNGDTPLAYGIRRYEPEVVKQLIELGANVNGENIDKAMNLTKTIYKEDSYYRRYIDETIKLVEEARAKKKKE